MSDELIINDIDVSDCEYLDHNYSLPNESECLATCKPYPEGAVYDKCEYKPNCYYKQLKVLKNENKESVSDLMIKLDKVKQHNKLLINCLDTKDELCKALREDNDNLRYKNELYLEKIKKLEGLNKND